MGKISYRIVMKKDGKTFSAGYIYANNYPRAIVKASLKVAETERQFNVEINEVMIRRFN